MSDSQFGFFNQDNGTIHEVTRNFTKRPMFRDASCDFVDRALTIEQKSLEMTCTTWDCGKCWRITEQVFANLPTVQPRPYTEFSRKAHWCSWLTRCPLKAEITGSSPVCATIHFVKLQLIAYDRLPEVTTYRVELLRQ